MDNKHMHIWHINLVTQKPFKRKGKTGVGMTPTNIHYCSNKVHLLRLQCLTINRSTLWKAFPIKVLQRLLGLTLLKDFNTLLEVCLIKGL